MKTTAVRIYGEKDLRLEEFELPELKDDEILASVVSDSICMSSYKAAVQGPRHKRVPDDVASSPTIIGHEFSGKLVKVGIKWQNDYKVGQKYAIQPALNYKGSQDAPGYSFKYIGGNATYVIIPNEVMEMNCLLPYSGDSFYLASLAEPMSCVIGAFHANYHTTNGVYEHKMGIVQGGNMAILAAAGPMGLGAIDYIINCDRRPGLLVVTDIDDVKLKRASELFPVEEAAKKGVELHFLNTSNAGDLLALTDGKGFDDVFVYAPVAPLIELADKILGRDGCLNFFAGPTDTNFSAKFNFYNVHYASTHIAGTSGGNTDDMREALSMMESGAINPSAMITHIGGLDSVIETTLKLPDIPGGKKLIYTHISMPLTAVGELKNSTDPVCKALAEIVEVNGGLWCLEAEKYLLKAKG